jgi:SAM-dependent methyltransferase
MEVLEHLTDQEGLVREMARVCGNDGIALISTPNKAAYSDARGYSNPFHVREFYRGDFLELLGRHFARVELLLQQVRSGSLITCAGGGDARLHEIVTEPAPKGSNPGVDPMYFLAICSHRDLSEPLPVDSAYLDLTDGLLTEWSQRLQDAAVEIDRLNGEIKRLGVWAKGLEGTIGQRDRALDEAQHRFDAEIEARDQTILKLQEDHERHADSLQEEILYERRQIARQQEEQERLRVEFDERGRWANSLENRVAERDELLRRTNESLDRTDADLRRVTERLARIRHRFLFRVLHRLRLLPD